MSRYAAVMPKFSHRPKDPPILADNPPPRIRAALGLLRQCDRFDDAASIVRLVPTRDRVLLVAAMRGRAVYPQQAFHAVVDACDEADLIEAFGDLTASGIMGMPVK